MKFDRNKKYTLNGAFVVWDNLYKAKKVFHELQMALSK
jgi:hypothetical protein